MSRSVKRPSKKKHAKKQQQQNHHSAPDASSLCFQSPEDKVILYSSFQTAAHELRSVLKKCRNIEKDGMQ